MKSKLTCAVWLVFALLGCSRAHDGEVGDSSTHWLKRCEGSAECGALACVCGICSMECGGNEQCSALGERASCETPTTASCGAPVAAGVCERTCGGDGDCGVEAPVCSAGRCRKAGAGGMSRPGDASVASEPSLPFLCPPQRAQSSGDACEAVAGYAWDGAACKEIVCNCAGEDCASMYQSREACEADHADRCHPPTTCADSWVHCKDVCPARWVLLGAGRERAGGRCPICSYDLEFVPTVLDVGGCTSLGGTLDLDLHDGAGPRAIEFRLTPRAWEEAFQLSLALAAADLSSLTSCAEGTCTPEAGQVWISRLSKVSASSERFAYAYDQVPPILRQVDTFMQDLIDQVSACRGPSLERCLAVSNMSDGPPQPTCGDDVPIASVSVPSCDCRGGFDGLLALNGSACSAACVSCNVPDSSCGALCVQPCAGGEPIWSTFCTE